MIAFTDQQMAILMQVWSAPRGWTVSCGGFDSLPGVVILELCWA